MGYISTDLPNQKKICVKTVACPIFEIGAIDHNSRFAASHLLPIAPNPSQTIPLAPSGKSPLEARPSRARKEGRIAIVTDVGRGMRWTLCATQDERGQACGEIVWSRSPDAGITLATMLAHHAGHGG
jgi:hypothetical protein